MITIFITNTPSLQKGVAAPSENLYFQLNAWHISTFATHYWCKGTYKEFRENGSGEQSKVNAGFKNGKPQIQQQ